MESPVRIFFVGNSPQGGKLRARFEGKDLPNSVQIKGTNDVQPVKIRRNNKGVIIGRWTSKVKYSSRMQTLQFLQCGHIVQEMKYDSCGDEVVDNPTATITNGTATQSNGTVTLSWTSVTEMALDQYACERKLSSSPVWEEPFDAEEPQGPGTTYSATDVPTVAGSTDYRLRGIFNDGSDKVLMTQTLNVVLAPTPHATITSFSAVFDPNSGTVAVSWHSTEEVSIQGYSVRRSGPGVPTAVEVIHADPTGANSNYNFPDSVDNAGDYTYTLVAILANGTDQQPALGTVVASVVFANA